MLSLPAFPGWTGLHPFISHFPIALLLAAPVLVLVGLLLPARRRSLLEVASWLLVAGTLFVYVSAASGDAARDAAKRPPEIAKAIEAHEDAGSIARVAFTVLSVLLVGALYVPRIARAMTPRSTVVLGIAFLVLYAGAALVLVQVGQTGGLLVHKLGVHAVMP